MWLVAHPRQFGNQWAGQRPGLQDISGGANFANKADNGIVVHRDWARLRELRNRAAAAFGKPLGSGEGGSRGRRRSRRSATREGVGDEGDDGEEAEDPLEELQVQVFIEKVGAGARCKGQGSGVPAALACVCPGVQDRAMRHSVVKKTVPLLRHPLLCGGLSAARLLTPCSVRLSACDAAPGHACAVQVRNKSTGSRGEAVLYYDRASGRYYDARDTLDFPQWEASLEGTAAAALAAAAPPLRQQQEEEQAQEQGVPAGQAGSTGNGVAVVVEATPELEAQLREQEERERAKLAQYEVTEGRSEQISSLGTE